MKHDVRFLVEHVNKSIVDAHNSLSKLTDEVLKVEGMTGKNTRHLYNNLCSLDDINYMEVGLYKGSSFISSVFNNNVQKAYAIDNWSEFGGNQEDFIENLKRHVKPHENVTVINKDCFSIDKHDVPLKSIDVYLYDGPHDYESHKKAIVCMKPFLSKLCLIVVDDWLMKSWGVQVGTMDGFIQSNIKVLYQFQVPSYNIPVAHQDCFWNGCAIFLCHVE